MGFSWAMLLWNDIKLFAYSIVPSVSSFQGCEDKNITFSVIKEHNILDLGKHCWICFRIWLPSFRNFGIYQVLKDFKWLLFLLLSAFLHRPSIGFCYWGIFSGSYMPLHWCKVWIHPYNQLQKTWSTPKGRSKEMSFGSGYKLAAKLLSNLLLCMYLFIW